MFRVNFFANFKFENPLYFLWLGSLTLLFLTEFVGISFSRLATSSDLARKNNQETSLKNVVRNQTDSILAETTKSAEGRQVLSERIKNQTSTGGVYLGMWTQGFFDSQSHTLHPEKLKELENKIGKKVAIAHYYRGWEELEKPVILNELNAISANGWRPMISVNPYFFNRCSSNGLNLYKAIAAGNCDDFLHSIGRNLKQFTTPFFLRFAWEMNIDSMEWGVSRTGSTPKDFVSAWRRFHDILKQENATNIWWVWSPDVGGDVNLRNLYPGDAYVDWLGLDGYNWGTTQPWSSWQSFSQVFSSSYKNIIRISAQKPLMIAEVNSTHVGGDKPVWYGDALKTQIPKNFPQVKAIVFYNEDRMQKENVNWLIDITLESLNAFREAISNPVYLPSF